MTSQVISHVTSPGANNLGNNDRINMDSPPFSRVFVVCSKQHREEDLRTAFENFGTIDDVWMVKDRMTKENKGICYIKYDKASSAALAIENLDGKIIGEEPKPIKAMIASSKNSSMKTDYQDESSRNRLFVVCPRDFNEEDLKAKFLEYGDFDFCNIIRDKHTGESKGFGYVKFTKASTAAVAMESCDPALKAILAEPKSAKFAREAAAAAVAKEQQRYSLRDSFGLESTSPTHSHMDLFLGSNGGSSYSGGSRYQSSLSQSPGPPEVGINNRLFVIVNQIVSQEQLSRLFDLVPGMESCDLKRNHATGDSRGFAYVSYTSLSAAMYAKEKLNGFEYPPGQKLTVKYAEDPPMRYPPSPTAEPYYYHSAPHSPLRSPTKGSPVRSLSPVRPLRQRRHSFSNEFDGRVFFICNPTPPAEHVLRDVFVRFGVLTDIWVVRGKNYGYAKFSTRSAAEAAITALHGMEVFGTKLKVMMADPPPEENSKNKRPQ